MIRSSMVAVSYSKENSPRAESVGKFDEETFADLLPKTQSQQSFSVSSM